MVEQNDELEALFAQARQDRDALPIGLSARMMADAAQVQAELARPVVQPEPAPGRWAQFKALMGGWPGLSGLATACAVGVWIGISPPAFVPDPVELVLAQNTELDLFGSAGLSEFASEEG